MRLFELSEMIAAMCPIEGINSSGVVFYRHEATHAERSAADALMAEYLPLIEQISIR